MKKRSCRQFLIGTESLHPILGKEALAANFTNEGGIDYRFRFLKNIMGMWLFQNIRKNLNKKYTYDEMMQMSMASSFTEKIDPTDQSFLAQIMYQENKSLAEMREIVKNTFEIRAV